MRETDLQSDQSTSLILEFALNYALTSVVEPLISASKRRQRTKSNPIDFCNSMTISKHVRSQFFTTSSTTTAEAAKITTGTLAAALLDLDAEASTLIRLPLTRPIPGKRKRKSRTNKSLASQQRKALGWSDEEHDRFLHALELHPTGPWKNVAAFVGTRTTRQVMTHAQKYRQKIERRRRGLQIPVRRSKGASEQADADNEVVKVEKATSTSTSPPSVETMADWRVLSSATVDCGDLSKVILESSSFGRDDLQLLTEDLDAEAQTKCMEQFLVDDPSSTTTMVGANDPLTFMFQDLSSFSWLQSKTLPADVEYSWGFSASHRAFDCSFLDQVYSS